MSKTDHVSAKHRKTSVCRVVQSNPSGKSSQEQVQLVPCRLTAADLQYVDTITCGNFTEIIRTRRKQFSEIIVAKAFDNQVWRAEYLYSAELRFLKTVQGQWIVKFLGYIEDLEENFVLLEYLPGGDLLQLIREHNLAESQIRFYAAEMFLAVDFVHQNGFMHRNIMLSNFLLHTSGHLRLVDFGLSYQYTPLEKTASGKVKPLVTSPVFATSTSSVATSSASVSSDPDTLPRAVEGNTPYCSPEMLKLVLPRKRFKKKAGYSHLCDYWSLGVAIYNMLYRRLPFEADTSGCVMDKVLNFQRTLTFPLDQKVSYVASNLIGKGLLVKEKRRLGGGGISEVKQHLWFQKIEWDSLGKGVVSLPISVHEVERYYRPKVSDRPEIPQPDNGARRRSGREPHSEESDDDDLEELRSIQDRHISLDFDVPLCNDPTVLEQTSLSSPGTSIIKRQVPVLSSTDSNKSLLTGRRSFTSRSERQKEVKARDASYSQRLLAWFIGPPSSGGNSNVNRRISITRLF